MKNKSVFVFDTNAFISIALFPASTLKKALKRAEELGEIVLSYDTLSELAAVLLRKKFDRYLSVEDRLEFLSRIETRYRVIKTVSSINSCRDPKDNILLELAVDVSATCLITGDSDLIALNPFQNIPIMSANNFLNAYNNSLFTDEGNSE